MQAIIHVDRSEAVRAAGLDDEKLLHLRDLEKLSSIGRRDLACSARGLAARVGFLSRQDACGKQTARPRLKRNLAEFWFGGKERIRWLRHVGGEEAEVRSGIRARERNRGGRCIPGAHL